MDHDTLKESVKSIENFLVMIDSMKDKKYVSQMGENIM